MPTKPLIKRYTDEYGNKMVAVAEWFYEEMAKSLDMIETWQPIETAPLLTHIIVAGEAVHPHTGWYVCVASNNSTGKFYTEQGELKNQPTLWKPMPDAPIE